MKIGLVRGIVITSVLLVTLLIFILVVRYDFPVFKYAGSSVELVEVATKSIGLEVSRFLWTYRLIDLIAQAFVLFAVATCCLVILRDEEEKW